MAEELEEGLDLSTEQDLDPNAGTDNPADITDEGMAESKLNFTQSIVGIQTK
jgi:hypothetical protein